jgi:hypothetical protein
MHGLEFGAPPSGLPRPPRRLVHGSTAAQHRFVAYNTRLLILPWVQVPHLASHILGRTASLLSNDWEQLYGHPVFFAETFIESRAFSGEPVIEPPTGNCSGILQGVARFRELLSRS